MQRALPPNQGRGTNDVGPARRHPLAVIHRRQLLSAKQAIETAIAHHTVITRAIITDPISAPARPLPLENPVTIAVRSRRVLRKPKSIVASVSVRSLPQVDTTSVEGVEAEAGRAVRPQIEATGLLTEPNAETVGIVTVIAHLGVRKSLEIPTRLGRLRLEGHQIETQNQQSIRTYPRHRHAGEDHEVLIIRRRLEKSEIEADILDVLPLVGPGVVNVVIERRGLRR